MTDEAQNDGKLLLDNIPEMGLEELKEWARSIGVREKNLGQRRTLIREPQVQMMRQDTLRAKIREGAILSKEQLAEKLAQEKRTVIELLKGQGMRMEEVKRVFETRGGLQESVGQGRGSKK